MRILSVIFLGFLFSCSNSQNIPKEKFLVGGSGWREIVVLDKQSGVVEWRHSIGVEDVECNSVDRTDDGNILYAYKKGARLITPNQEVLWDYVGGEGTEIHSAEEIAKGRYLIGVCGTPSRLIELDDKGAIISELLYDTGVENSHNQFRKVTKTRAGNYIVPIFGKSIITEIDGSGNVLRSVNSVGTAFSVIETEDGKWLSSCGDEHKFVVIDPDSGEVLIETSQDKIKAKMAYVAETIPYGQGNTLICNWSGHSDDGSEPKLVEIDAGGNVIWQLSSESNDIGMVSSVCAYLE